MGYNVVPSLGGVRYCPRMIQTRVGQGVGIVQNQWAWRSLRSVVVVVVVGGDGVGRLWLWCRLDQCFGGVDVVGNSERVVAVVGVVIVGVVVGGIDYYESSPIAQRPIAYGWQDQNPIQL